jgi:hypothetical protein
MVHDVDVAFQVEPHVVDVAMMLLHVGHLEPQELQTMSKGRLIPDPCYIALQKWLPAKDDRLCTKCYKDHLHHIHVAQDTCNCYY